MGTLLCVPGLDWGFGVNWRTHDQIEAANEGFHFDTCSAIVFYLAWLNCNTFSVHIFLGVASGGGKKHLLFFGSFFSTHVLCIKMSVIQSVHNQYLLELGKNNLCLCSEPAGSCVNMSSILPWEDLFAWMWCSTPWSDNFQPVQNQGRCKHTLPEICNSVFFPSVLYCHKGTLPFSEIRFLLESVT